MSRDVTQNAGQGPDLERVMLGYCNVMLPAMIRRQTDMAASLTSDAIAK